MALLLLDAHRMLDFQSAELQKFRTYQKLFRDAFPEEAVQADAAGGDLNLPINDLTVLQATATFLRLASHNGHSVDVGRPLMLPIV